MGIDIAQKPGSEICWNVRRTIIMSNNLTEKDYMIQAYINQRTDGRYDEVIQPEGRWEIFTALSELRTSLFNWYDFSENASVLEVNAGYGAVTGAFLRKGLTVTAVEPDEFKADCLKRRFVEESNLNVENCSIEDYINKSSSAQYIYIILTDVLNGNDVEGSRALMEKLSTLLKEDGKFLISCPNKYGLRYLCGNGDADDHMPFGSLDNNASTHFTREDLVESITGAGLQHYKFYYPLPTHTITQAVYTDEHLPSVNIGERINFYGDRKDEELVADEKKLYKDVVENGTFSFHANSYLLECGRVDNLSTITYATVTTDRGFESGSSTAVCKDTVTKTAIYQEGKKSIDQILQSGIELKNRGIAVVQNRKLSDSSLQMPYIDAPTLSDVLRIIVNAGDKDKWVSIFDKLNEQILRSSDECNTNEFPGADENTDYGPLRSTLYIDMIPLNCFYQKAADAADEQFIFFDQEFVRHNWPANYVMFRALRYTYGTVSEAQNVIPLTEFQLRYGITAALWDQYEAEEVRFVNANRRYDLYQCFYYKTVWSDDQILKNRLRLACSAPVAVQQSSTSDAQNTGTAEVGQSGQAEDSNIIVTVTPSAIDVEKKGERSAEETSFQISPELQAIWDVELDLLRLFKSICDEHRLTYYLWAGSMLGAARHEGIIPWDDDIDVAMPRKDFEKFKAICKETISAPYYLQSDDDHNIFMGGKLRLRNSNTTGFEFREAKYGGNWGIWIDILALDFVYKNEKKKARQLKRIGRTVEACKADSENHHIVSSWHLNCFNRAVLSCPESEAGSVRPFTAAFNIDDPRVLQTFELSLFKKQILLKYQDLLMPVPSKYDAILRMQYEDYTRLIPIEQRKPSHVGVFKPDVPYIVYQRRITEAIKYDSSKTVVLFGAGNMIHSYMERHGRKHRPAFIVDNNAAKWGLEYKGVAIYKPDKLKDYDPSSLHIIICNNYYAQIAEQLEGMGINDYYLYVETLTNLSNVLFPGYTADGKLDIGVNITTEPIDFFGYGVGKRIDENTGLVVPSDDTYMTSDKVWHAYRGAKLVLKNKQYHYTIATYNATPDGTLIYTYLYAPDMNWTSYNHDMVERGFVGRDYVFEDERYFRVMLTRLDGGEIPKIAETEGILEFVNRVPESSSPELYYEDEIELTSKEIAEAKESTIAPLTIALLADTHYAPGTTWDKSLQNVRAVNERVLFDNIIHLGDLTDGLGSKLLTKHYAEYVMNDIRSLNLPTYLTVGNHDTNYFHGNPDVYSLPEQYDAYHSGKDPVDVVRNGADLWYYVDRYPQKLRMLFLGSYDASRHDRYGFWEEEVEWVKQTLSCTSADWCVIVFSHLPLLPEMHYWTRDLRNADRLLAVLERFNIGEGGSGGAGEAGRLLGYIHGHNHCDQINTAYGFPIISLGSNKMEYFTYYKPEGAVIYNRTAGTASEDLWDTLVIDTNNRKLSFIRFGAGENREIRYK